MWFKKKPVMRFSQVKCLPNEDAGPDKTIARVYNRYIDADKKDPDKFRRRQSITITNRKNGSEIVHVIMGGSDKLQLDRQTVGLDYDAMDLLGLRRDEEVDLEMRPATLREIYSWFWRHPDPGYQISTRIALVSFFLGLVSMVPSLIELYLAF